jgi:hypothetical protein
VNRLSPLLSLAACLTATLLTGCPPPPLVAVRPYLAPSADELLRDIQTSQKPLRGLRARAKADVLGTDGRVKVDISLLAARPQLLRLAAENALTGPLLTLATNGESFALLDVRENRYHAGPVSACNMARILGVALHPRQVIEVLLGGVPLLPDAVGAEVGWAEGDGGREVLTLRGGDGLSQVIYLQRQEAASPSGRPHFDVREAEGRDASGQVVWRLRHEGFTDQPLGDRPGAATVRLPGISYIEDPPHHSDIRLRWRERELNPALPGGIFQLERPEGMAVEPDPCQVGAASPLAEPPAAAAPGQQ